MRIIIILIFLSFCSRKDVVQQERLPCTFDSKQITVALTALESRNLIVMDYNKISLAYHEIEVYEQYFMEKELKIGKRKILITDRDRKITHLTLLRPEHDEKEQVFIRFIVNDYGGKEINGSITYKCKENELVFRDINFITLIE